MEGVQGKVYKDMLRSETPVSAHPLDPQDASGGLGGAGWHAGIQKQPYLSFRIDASKGH